MDLELTSKKLNEARFALEHLRREARRTFGDHEPFDYYLDAFLTAARSVAEALEKECKHKLSTEDGSLLKFMRRQRNKEVHEGSAEKTVDEVGIPVHNVHEDEFGRLEVFGPPAVLSGTPGPQATLRRPVRYFHIGGEKCEVTQVCGRYIELLERLVQQFVEAHRA